MFADGSDLVYLNETSQIDTSSGQFARILVVGQITDALAEWIEGLPARAVRSTSFPSAARRLHDGIYGSLDGDDVSLVIVASAMPPTEAETARLRTCRSHLADAFEALEDHWANSREFVGSAPFRTGDIVRARGQRELGRVAEVRRTPEGHAVIVAVGGRRLTYFSADLDKVEGDPDSAEFWLQQEPASADDVARTLSWTKLAFPLSDFLYSYAATRTAFRGYQFLPAIRLLNGVSGKLLIADEVGLGKTIEAGLIWTELEQRASIERGLVVVPAALQFKWKREMEARFMRKLEILKKGAIAEFLAEIRAGREPGLTGIISIESLRSDSQILAELNELRPRFDLAIVDEAHVVRNRGTRSWDVGNFLSDQADHLILLSATPLNLGQHDLFNLVNLLDAGAFPDAGVFVEQLRPNQVLNRIVRAVATPEMRSKEVALRTLHELHGLQHGRAITRHPDYARLEEILRDPEPFDAEQITSVKRLASDLNTLSSVLNRTRKVDVQEKKALRVVEDVVVQWTPEERALYDAIETLYIERAQDRSIPRGFMLQMPLRQASSCLPVALKRIAQKEGWLTEDERLTDYEGDLDGDAEQLYVVNSPLGALSTDSKLDALLQRLRRARQQGLTKVLIFSFFRGTVEYLANRLTPEFRTRFLHGGVAPDERDQVISQFRSGEFEILIANQVGSEGLDFEFCNILVNYDLPWNPMQIEQRIGRLDRIGQVNEKIFIFNMSIPGTIETEIVGRLYTRINIFEQSVGDLEPIMRETMRELSDRLLDPTLTELQRHAEIDRQAQVIDRNRADIERLEENSGLLTTVRELEIDGLTESGPSSGRYVGPAELHRLLMYVVDKFDARLTLRGDRRVLTGSPELARAARTAASNSQNGSMFGAELYGRIRDRSPIDVVFRPEDDANGDCELISGRHPLIRLAVEELRNDSLARPRFGRIALVTQGGRRHLVSVSLVETHGIRTQREMWVTAVDAASGERTPGVEEQLLVALAEDGFADPPEGDSQLDEVLPALESIERARAAEARQIRGAENAALVEARIQSQRHTIEIKLAGVQRQWDDQVSERSDERYVRMIRGRLAGLRADLDAVGSDFEARRHFVLTSERVALLDVLA